MGIRIGVVLTAFLIGVGLASAQQAPQTERPSPGSFRLNETEITGELKDVLRSLKMLETEIVGTVERPGLGYSLPWKDPDPAPSEKEEEENGLWKAMYAPLDRERFIHEIRSGSAAGPDERKGD